MNARRITVGLSTAALALGLLTGCSLPEGPAGVVVAKPYRTFPASKARPYFLTVRTPDGEQKSFQVHVKNYRRCDVNENYPACTRT
ncbi:hypothetical protein [Streptomyces sp. NPDC050145]|uniref:hypothetical protein n=1 Tax=Streptomyces sp. NPDC050145 TaxID=3365602 RepID=UPI0037B17C5F